MSLEDETIDHEEQRKGRWDKSEAEAEQSVHRISPVTQEVDDSSEGKGHGPDGHAHKRCDVKKRHGHQIGDEMEDVLFHGVRQEASLDCTTQISFRGQG